MSIAKNINQFPYEWNLSDGYNLHGKKLNGLKVFGTFICGGGSTMGYKLAGFNHIGGVEIDPKVSNVYSNNHHPKYLFTEDIRHFVNRNDLPQELFELDILDGSPPCSSFSMAGNREKDWGKEKIFREGQALQTLDDLFFDFINLGAKLKPKVIIAENVKGLIQGNAKGYVKRIRDGFENSGYSVQLFLFNSATMGVPQKRERVFFICHRKELNYPKLKFHFDERQIRMSEIIDDEDKSCRLTEYQKKLWDNKISSDKTFGDVIMRTENRLSMFSNPLIRTNDISPTITSSAAVNALHKYPRPLNKKELCKIGTFPQDYNFGKIKPDWLIGMSVPPIMTAQISNQIYLQWFKK